MQCQSVDAFPQRDRERGRRDGRNGVRGVRVGVVEQPCLLGGRGRRKRQVARGGAACCCECGAAVWQPDAGVVHRSCWRVQRVRRDQRAVVGLRVRDCCRAGAGQPELQR